MKGEEWDGSYSQFRRNPVLDSLLCSTLLDWHYNRQSYMGFNQESQNFSVIICMLPTLRHSTNTLCSPSRLFFLCLITLFVLSLGHSLSTCPRPIIVALCNTFGQLWKLKGTCENFTNCRRQYPSASPHRSEKSIVVC